MTGGAPIRIAVTGRDGQVVQSLLERAAVAGVTVVAVGRPLLDLARPDTIAPALMAAQPDVIVNAAAYTAVDQAEKEEALATAINGAGAGAVAAVAARLNVPVIHLSTDYVFDGSADRPYRENDLVAPIGAYGRSKLAGERAVAAATANHCILRTAWVYSPFGKNFVKTMLRLGESQREVRVVADQHGNPTSALDLADTVIAVARHLAFSDAADLRGIFHMTNQGDAVWADVAEAIFAAAEAAGRPPVQVRRIATAEFPTPARRPANSRLDGAKLLARHGLALPPWEMALDACLQRLLQRNAPPV